MKKFYFTYIILLHCFYADAQSFDFLQEAVFTNYHKDTLVFENLEPDEKLIFISWKNCHDCIYRLSDKLLETQSQVCLVFIGNYSVSSYMNLYNKYAGKNIKIYLYGINDRTWENQYSPFLVYKNSHRKIEYYSYADLFDHKGMLKEGIIFR